MQKEALGRILVVDDEPQITRVVRSALISNGYAVEVASDGFTALAKLAEWSPDMVITDLSMPRMDGIALCSEIRRESNLPILVLSVRDQDDSKIKALDAGADDYVTKPFSMEELLARVRAHMRRLWYTGREAEAIPLEIGDFRIDPDKRLVEVCGREVHLSPKEFDLLFYMAQRPERVLTHRKLLTAIWGARAVEQPESLRVLVAMLRKKIEPEGEPKYIINDPWVGYRFEPGNRS
ncbi:MAG TPA: response regulator transcription factor [Edaphobacter sp.]|nr:response regulator transcription factor [Edaphobacter sp.]